MMQKLRALGDRWPWLGRMLDVQERFGEINGGFAASAIAITVFISIFPLLLVIIAVIGFIAAGNDDLAADLIEQLGLTGPGAQTLTDALEKASQSARVASIVGLVGLTWAGSAVAVALQQGVRLPWQERSNGIKDRLLGMAWLAVAALGFLVVIALSGMLNVLPDSLPLPLVAVASAVLGFGVDVALFVWMFWGLGKPRVGWRDLLPGAVIAAVGFEILKLVGTVLVPQMVSRSSALYGSIGIVFAVLAWLAIFARLLVYCSTFNAVRYEAREGTVEVPIRVTRIPGRTTVAANRGGIALPEPPPTPIT